MNNTKKKGRLELKRENLSQIILCIDSIGIALVDEIGRMECGLDYKESSKSEIKKRQKQKQKQTVKKKVKQNWM